MLRAINIINRKEKKIIITISRIRPQPHFEEEKPSCTQNMINAHS